MNNRCLSWSGLFSLCVLLAVCSACAGESAARAAVRLERSFPNYALVLPRESPAGPVDTAPPFSWPQTIVMYEGVMTARLLGGYDPGLQPVQFDMAPSEPVNVKVDSFDGTIGLIQATAKAKTGGLTEVFLFRVQARGLTSQEAYPLTFDIRPINTRTRGAPVVTRSPGAYIRPGQIVRYAWTQTGRAERRPKAEAEFVGRTGPATGLYTSTITEVLALKVQPFVLGHYLLTVTPRDVRGEPPRGSTSNGQVFRCAFGSDNLPPATDGCAADTFTPAVNQTVTIAPVAFDPETGRSVFDNEVWDFGDGTLLTGVSGAATHAYAQPGIYRVRCTVVDDLGLPATAEDNVVVGATPVQTLPFTFVKQITPDEAGIGLLAQDSFAVTFPGANAQPGDRIVFCFNRNRFGRLVASDGGDTEIVLKSGGGFSGATALAKNVTVQAGGGRLAISVSGAQLDRTGDPRLGRADLKGIFRNQRLAACIVPADGSPPRVLLYTGNVELRVRGGQTNRLSFIPEEKVTGKSTSKEPDPKKQELP